MSSRRRFLSLIGGTAASHGHLFGTHAAFVPANGAPSFNANHAQFNVDFRFTRKLGLNPTDKVLLYGDSRSSTDYSFNQAAVRKLTGCNVYNGGFSGYTAAQLARNAQTQRIFTYAPNVIFALIGGNDTGSAGTVGTFSGATAGEPVVTPVSLSADYNGTYFIQAIDYFIRSVQAHYYNIRARAGLTGTETEAVKNAMIAAVQPKPALFVATDLPQQRGDTTNPFSQRANWQRKHDAIVECCTRNLVPCIDLLNLTPFANNMALEQFWPGPGSVGGGTNMTDNTGVYFMDGLHPNQFGWEIIAQVYCWAAGL